MYLYRDLHTRTHEFYASLFSSGLALLRELSQSVATGESPADRPVNRRGDPYAAI